MRRFSADSGIIALSYVNKKNKQAKHINIFKEPNQDLFYTAYNEPVYKTLKELIEDDPNLKKPYESNPSVYKEYIKQFTAARVESQEKSTDTSEFVKEDSSSQVISDKSVDDENIEKNSDDNNMFVEPSDVGLVFQNLESGKYK